MNTSTTYLRLWIVVLGTIAGLGAGLFGLILLVEKIPPALWIGLLLGGMAIGTVVIILALRAITSPRAYRELRQIGRRVPAQVLEIERTKWRRKRGSGTLFQAERIVAWQHRMQLRIDHPERGSYEVTHFAYLPVDTAIKRRSTVEVLVHPQQPEVLALVEEEPS